ncbi:MAG: sensor histidine kinase [Chloroflexota bacterium]
MNQSTESQIRTSSDADLAFAVVVLASFFATFSSMKAATPLEIILMIVLGTSYLTIGIYGFAYCSKSQKLILSIAYFIIQILLGAWIVYLGKGAGFNAMVLLPLAGHAVILLPRRISYFAQFSILLAYVVAVYAFSDNLQSVWEGLPIFFAGLVFIVVFTQMALNEEASRREVERLVGELTHANQQLRDYAAQIEDLAIIKERNRLAREIHDGLGHYLTSIHMQIKAASALLNNDPQKSAQHLQKAITLTQEALSDVRQSVGTLRSQPHQDIPLEKIIPRLLESAKSFGIEPELRVIGVGRELSATTYWTLFRAVQEGISNACKHSRARNLSVCLDYSSPDWVVLTLQDDGVGVDNLKEGFGLMGLRERVQIVGGDFQLLEGPSKGFGFKIKVPA